jgi:hypothetical protein
MVLLLGSPHHLHHLLKEACMDWKAADSQNIACRRAGGTGAAAVISRRP